MNCHYGLHASGMRLKLQVARLLLDLPFEMPAQPQLDFTDWLQSFMQENPSHCPFCQQGTLRKWRPFARLDRWRILVMMVLGLAIYGSVEAQEAFV